MTVSSIEPAGGRQRPAPSALISPLRIGEINRSRVLQALYDLGPLSRADLARLAGVSRGVIGAIVQPMLDQDLLVERAPRPSGAGGGKPSRPLWFSPTAAPIATGHLLPGHVQTALVAADGEIISTFGADFDAAAPDGREATACLLRGLRTVLENAERPPMGVGIAVGGMVDTDHGTIVRINLAPGLDGLELGPLLAERLGLPVHLDLHPRVQALGDRWFGQGRGRERFASVYTGEALGVGLVLGGTVDRGPCGAGGEIGHSIVRLGGERCRCGQLGCWETVASHTWLRAEAARLGLPGAATLTAGPLSRLAERGHPQAVRLLDRWAANLAAGLVNLHQIVAPGLFILHGDTVAGGEAMRGRIEDHLRSAVPPHPAGPPRVTFTTLDDRATLLGAAGLVLSHHLLTRY